MNTGTSEQAIEQTSEQERECRRMTYNLVYNEIKFHGLNCIVRVSKPDDRSGVVRFILFLNLRIFELTVCTRLFHWHSTHFKTNRFCFPHSLSCWLQNICITIPPRSRSFWSSAFIVHSFSLFVLLLFDDLCFMIFMHFVRSFVLILCLSVIQNYGRFNFICRRRHTRGTLAFDIEHGIEMLCHLPMCAWDIVDFYYSVVRNLILGTCVVLLVGGRTRFAVPCKSV